MGAIGVAEATSLSSSRGSSGCDDGPGKGGAEVTATIAIARAQGSITMLPRVAFLVFASVTCYAVQTPWEPANSMPLTPGEERGYV